MDNFNLYKKAVDFATEKHQGQVRKGKVETPYIKHPLNVAQILANCDAKDEVIIAGILHDVVEDSPTTVEDLVKNFGINIASMVAGVTEKGENMTWKERLDTYLEKVKSSNNGSKMICAADKIDNMNSIIACLEDGYNIFDKMSAGKNEQLAKFKLILDTFSEDMPPKLKKMYEDTLSKLTNLCNQKE